MAFSFRPKSEVQMHNLLEKGDYSFEVISAEDAVSKAGNQMMKLVLKVYDNDGKTHLVYDYLLEALAFKLKHFCEATGLNDKYEEGKLEVNDCVGKSGKVYLEIQESGLYKPKNIVGDYIVLDKSTEGKTPSNSQTTFIDDDVPF